MITNANEILFRCSALGTIMTNDPSGKKMGKTCMDYLKVMHREAIYNRNKEFSNKYIEKGIAAEEDAITLLSRVKKIYFKKNTERLRNQYITGEPDLFIGKSILEAEEGYDTKCSWDLWTFPYAGEKLSNAYELQNQGYMALTGAKKWTTAYCLVDTPLTQINDEKYRLARKLDVIDTMDNPIYEEECERIERNMTYSDIPLKDRVIEFTSYRNDEKIEAIYQRIRECRAWMNKELFKVQEVLIT